MVTQGIPRPPESAQTKKKENFHLIYTSEHYNEGNDNVGQIITLLGASFPKSNKSDSAKCGVCFGDTEVEWGSASLLFRPGCKNINDEPCIEHYSERKHLLWLQ